MAATNQYECKCCRETFTARVADRNRGWARFCSKRCKAIKQVQKGGKYTKYQEINTERDWHTAGMDAIEWGWDGHKNVF